MTMTQREATAKAMIGWMVQVTRRCALPKGTTGTVEASRVDAKGRIHVTVAGVECPATAFRVV